MANVTTVGAARALFVCCGLCVGAACGNSFSGNGGQEGNAGSGGGEPGGGAGGTSIMGGASGTAAMGGAGASNAAGASAGGTGGMGAGGEGAAGGAAGMSGSAGSGGAPVQNDCLSVANMNSPNVYGATVTIVDHSTGNFVRSAGIPMPHTGIPATCAAAADGTYRLLWNPQDLTGTAQLLVLDAALGVTATRPLTYKPGWAVVGYAKRADGTGRVLWTSGTTNPSVGHAALVKLTAADEIDATVAVKVFDQAGSDMGAIGYSGAPDGTGRLLWGAAGFNSFGGFQVWFLTASDDASAKVLSKVGISSMREGLTYAWTPRSYAVDGKGTIWMGYSFNGMFSNPPQSTFHQGLVCAYAKEADIATISDVDGWGIGFCKRIGLSGFLGGYALFPE